jgi:hypothetical protein
VTCVMHVRDRAVVVQKDKEDMQDMQDMVSELSKLYYFYCCRLSVLYTTSKYKTMMTKS